MRLVDVLTVALLVSACTPAPHDVPPPGAEPAELMPVGDGHPVVDALPDPELSGGHVGRAPRRLTVAQLKQSIRVTTGRDWAGLEGLAASLGRADYALVNAEATETNLVFAKFLEDGAREVCLATADADLAQPDVAQRVLSPKIAAAADLAALDEARVRENLVYLSTRFWGLPLAGDELATWTASAQRIAARAKAQKKPREAWAALCIALLTDARFITY